MSKVLVPADSIRAEYVPRTQTLTLVATGSAPGYIYDIHFERADFWVGGVKFELVGWSGVGIPEYRDFRVEQKFIIPNLERVAPGGAVVVVTANHPQGQKVPVRWLGLGGEPTDQPLAVAGTESSKLLDRNTTTRKVLFKEPFDITSSVDCTPGSTVRIEHNDKVLVIQGAGVEDGNLTWTFNSLETGNTQVIVYKTHGLTDIITRKVYNIEVYVLENAVTAADIQDLNKGSDSNALAWTFKERLLAAVAIVKRQDPTAQLIKVKATPGLWILPPESDTPLNVLEAWFNSRQGTWYTKSPGGMTWSKPVLVYDYILGLDPIIIPDLKYDLDGAIGRLRGDGIGGAISSAELYKRDGRPGAPPNDPEYVFFFVDQRTYSVNARTGVITQLKTAISFTPTDASETAGDGAVANGTNGTALKQIEAPLPPVGVAA